MSRALLVNSVLAAVKANHPKVEITTAAANTIVDTFTSTIVHNLKTTGHFSLSGFGTFRTAARAARAGVNPQTQAKISIPASQTVAFKPAAQLKSDAAAFTLPAKRGSAEAKKVVASEPPVAKKVAKASVTKTSTKKAAAKK